MTKKLFLLALLTIFVFNSTTPAFAKYNFGPKNDKKEVVVREIIPNALIDYPVGEKLIYEIKWLGIPIGKGEVILYEGKSEEESYRVEVKAKGNDFLNAFFPVEDILVSKINSKGYSSYYEKNVKEGRYRAHEELIFDYDDNLAKYHSLTNGSNKEFSIKGDVHDVLSAFYWLRKQPMKTGDILETTVFNDEKNWDLFFKVKNTRKINIPGEGKKEAVVLVPEAKVNGEVKGRGKVKIYISKDERRIPVLVKLKTPFGAVVGTLSK